MLTSCMGENGCGTLVHTDQRYQPQTSSQSTPNLHRSQMTNVVSPIPETTNYPTGTGSIASNMPMPGIWSDENGVERIPGIPDPNPDPVLPENPQFQVPANPLLPPGYQEMISYENLQYMNGFLRTQIGKYLHVEQLISTNQIEDRYGYLVGVGLNYILLQQAGTGNISAIDYYSIKYVYVYYQPEDLPR